MTFKEQWESYLQEVVPDNATSNQVEWLKKTFYAGAAATLPVVGKSKGDTEPLLNELRAFGDEVERDLARGPN